MESATIETAAATEDKDNGMESKNGGKKFFKVMRCYISGSLITNSQDENFCG
jgi:hypothetical protein